MSRWRVVETNSEQPTGVAPVCDKPELHVAVEDQQDGDFHSVEGPLVYDCCAADLVIECWGPRAAKEAAKLLTEADAELADG